VAGISRSGFRYVRKADDDGDLREAIRNLANSNKREGYRMIAARLKNDGWLINRKKVHRICKEEGLSLARKRPKRRQYGPKGEIQKKPEYPNHVWSYDFVEDRTSSNDRIRLLCVIDEYTRQALRVLVAPRLGSGEVLDTLSDLVAERGRPSFVRSDNGPEFVASEVKRWIQNMGSEMIYIEPGSPWQNGYMESFNGTLRNECLNMNIFHSGKEARKLVDEWIYEYNEYRPHSSLGYISPNEFARRYEG